MPPLPQARGAGTMTVVNNVLHYMGGADSTRTDRHDHWAFDLNNPAGAGSPQCSPHPTAQPPRISSR